MMARATAPAEDIGGGGVIDNLQSTLTIEARNEVRQSINRALIDEGYRKSDDGIVDFYVNFHADAQDKVDVDAVASTYGYYGYPGWYPTDSAVYVQQYKEGTLMIDIIDRTGKKLIWRGTGEARLSEHSTADDRRKAIDEAVRKVLAGFPPKPQ